MKLFDRIRAFMPRNASTLPRPAVTQITEERRMRYNPKEDVKTVAIGHQIDALINLRDGIDILRGLPRNAEIVEAARRIKAASDALVRANGHLEYSGARNRRER